MAVAVLSGCGDDSKSVQGINHAALRELSRLGKGMLVWERFREGKWQIWSQGIDGSGHRRLVPLENGRDHFCPKLSPDGRHLAYMSYERGETPYKKGQTAQLRMYDLQKKTARTIHANARSYAEDRAVMWFDESRFCYIDHEGHTVEHDLVSGSATRLTDAPTQHFGWLVNSTKTSATTGTPEFSPYDAATKNIKVQNRHAGCQPYFTQDGGWGFWVGGAGGPVNRMRLSTRLTGQMIRKNDDRLHKSWRYLYFPMVSPCRRLVTYGASRSEDDHDHFKADYEIFLGQIHPQTLELIGTPARATDWPECDRFPDVYREELPLGTHFVEGETELAFQAPGGHSWNWDLGDAGRASGASVKAVFRRSGHHFVSANSDTSVLRGYVHVSDPAPPKVAAVRREGAEHVVMHFDEPVASAGAKLTLADGRALEQLTVLNGGVSLRAKLPANSSAEEFFIIEGLHDTAQRVNTLPRTEVRIPGQSWPSNHEGLVFAWADNAEESRMADGFVCRLEPKRRAFWDEHHAMTLGGGLFEAPGAGERISEACKKTSEITVEMILTPFSGGEVGQMHRIFTIASDPNTRNITLGQKNGKLTLWMGTSDNGAEGNREEIALGYLRPDEMHHIMMGFRKRRLQVMVDGEHYQPRMRMQGGLENWTPKKLSFGAAPDGSAAWHGKIEGVAVFDRMVDAEEALEHYASSEALLGARVMNDEHRVRAKVLEVSRVPTLESITPYRNALMRHRYQVLAAAESFTEKEIVVSQWCWLDAQPMPAQKLKPGDEVELRLQSLEQNPQVKSLVNRDDVNGGLEALQYFEAGWARPASH